MRFLNILLLAAMLVVVQGCAGIGGKSADRRTQGTQLEDNNIEKKSMAVIEEKHADTSKVTVTSFNRFVLITGAVQSEDEKSDVERIVRTVPNVKKTANEIVVGEIPKYKYRRIDSHITSNIRSGLAKNKSVQADTIQVVTDRGVVYLLGLATHAEANIASEIASTTNGAKKVVRVFEYID